MTPAELCRPSWRSRPRCCRRRRARRRRCPRHVAVERPKKREHGDYATNVALQLAKPAGRPPREVAELLAAPAARRSPAIDAVDVAGPGFLNITPRQGARRASSPRTIVAPGPAYGRSDARGRQRVNLEFVSANPTGPLHLGDTRWAAVGDALARLLEAAGAEVDARVLHQRRRRPDGPVRRVAAGARRTGEPIARGRLRRRLHRRPRRAGRRGSSPGCSTLPDDEQLVGVPRATATRCMLAEIKRSLDGFGVDFDVWFSERDAARRPARSTRALARLREQGHVYEADGAVWLRTTDFGDDKDRVLVKSDGEPTYFAADTAYYLDKRERGFDRCIYLLGADHHGYVSRLQAVAACAGDDPDDNIEVLIGQLVKICRGRRAGADEQAGRHHRHPRRPRRRGRASTRPATRSAATRPTRRSTSTST